MQLDSAATAVATDGHPLPWPIPPYFRLESPQAESTPACVVALTNGRVIHAGLIGIEPGSASVRLALPGDDMPHRVGIEYVHSVRLAAPLLVRRNEDIAGALGVSGSEVPGERQFTIRFRDGQIHSGTTCGFVKENAGLFLFPIEGEPRQIYRSFVPAEQIEDLQIGPLLGQTQAIRELVSESVLTSALDRQAQLHEERIGTQLLERGIVTPEDLRQVLSVQEHRPAAKVGELLREAGLITEEQLSKALAQQAANRGRRIGDILVEMGAVTARQVQRAVADKLGIPFIDVRVFPLDASAVTSITPAFAARHQVLPLFQVGDALVVAVENPLAMDFAQDLRFLTGHSIAPVIADPRELRMRIAREYAAFDATPMMPAVEHQPGGPALTQTRLDDLTDALAREAPRAPPPRSAESEARVTDNALVRLVNNIIMDAHAQGASDIHIESNGGAGTTRIRFRKDGDLQDYLELQPAYRNALVSRIKIMAGLDIAEHRHAQDGKIAFRRFGPVPIDLRVAIIPTADNLEDAVLRILGGVEPLPLDALGFCERDLTELRTMVSRSYGLILVCGPTGSGKTTTLHSVLHHINSPDIKIWTAEDPVEITQSGLRQVQINSRIGWTFANAMRAFLRADPDVIMVGEMRDAETTKIGIEASLTGHLVFSTLHTNSAAESAVRLLDLGMDPFNFADALIGILSQRLARRLCQRCRKPRSMDDAELHAFAEEYCAGSHLEPAAVDAQWREHRGVDGHVQLHEAVGCEACHGGYKGRVGIYELLTGTPKIKEQIRTRGSVPAIVDAALAGGMRTLRQDAIEKVLDGALDLKSARAAFN
jgi:type II secretory ATPase GspE/PulE/Tfp pilus assembly ATPase PilB-like protein